ncbi:hypothetical protein ABZS66_31440 [Dactylosporangium sp. NPDC005572]|uniref:hypothetical protein n=1 Tax=Dactylosporangium sp. NPDC005572 TaxID=3156889 RepID=UPI0033A3054D
MPATRRAVDLRAASAPALGMPDKSRWGGYAVAVTRWELLLGRAFPDPSQPGRHGKPILAPPFVEWLMGLPQQAAAALCLLIDPARYVVPA